MNGPITPPINSLAIPSSFASYALSTRTPLVGVRNQTPRVRKAKSLTVVDVDWAAVCAGCFLHPGVSYGLDNSTLQNMCFSLSPAIDIASLLRNDHLLSYVE